MRILSLDTTTAAGSVALAADARVLEETPIDPTQPVATRLPGDLMRLLDRQGVELKQIDVFAVATGPGSFTGLRIGIATMQGLALADAKPLIGVSAFQALATLADAPRVAVWIDAWRGEVYSAVYARVKALALQPIAEPTVGAPEVLLQRRATSLDTATIDVFTGDGAVKYRDLIGRGRVIDPTPLIAGAIARLAYGRAAAGELPPPHAIRPLYVRRPDAELAREQR